MAWIHRYFRGYVSRESFPPHSLGADHALGWVLRAAGAAGAAAGGSGGSAGHRARSSALVRNRSLDQRGADRAMAGEPWALDRHQPG